MSRRAKRERELPDYAAMMRRMIRAHGRRVADADPEDLVELVELRAVLDAAIAEAVRGQRSRYDRSWAEIARVLGVSRQAAQQRYGDTPARPAGVDPRQPDLFIVPAGT